MTISSVALRLEQKRLEKGISHRALGIKSGVNHAYLKNLLEGKSQEPRRSKVEALAKALECPVEYFYENDVPAHNAIFSPEGALPSQQIHKTERHIAIPMYDLQPTEQGTSTLRLVQTTEWLIPAQDIVPFLSDITQIGGVIIRGNSMEPSYRSGERILFDLSINALTVDGIYLITTPAGLTIKQLQILPNSTGEGRIIRVSNKNPEYEAYTLRPDQIMIHGRAVAKWTWL